MPFQLVSARVMREVRPVEEADLSAEENGFSDEESISSSFSYEHIPAMNHLKESQPVEPQAPQSPTSSYLLSNTIFTSTLAQGRERLVKAGKQACEQVKDRVEHPETSREESLPKITSSHDLCYLPAIKTLYECIISLDAPLNIFLGKSDYVHREIPLRVQKIYDYLEDVVKASDKLGDLGDDRKAYGARKAVHSLVEIVKNMLSDAKKISEKNSQAEHGLLKDDYEEVVVEALRDALKELKRDVRAAE